MFFSPNFEMPALFGGIQPASPGFKTVLIEPQLGKLTHLKTTVPHWAGSLKVEIQKNPAGWKVEVELPPGITGQLIWKGRRIALKSGGNRCAGL
jgi:alpha-L-rhamnosidase